MMTPFLLALSLFGPPTGSIVLVNASAFLWKRRPEVRISPPAEDPVRGSIRLMITARDPQFFATTTVELTDGSGSQVGVMASAQSDSSSVDARLSTNRHTLWYRFSPDEVRAWGTATRPSLRLGTVRVTLDATGRRRLTEFIAQLPAPGTP